MARPSWSHSIDIDFRDMAEEIVEYIRDNFNPEEVFPSVELEGWAKDNGFTKPD